MKGILFVAHGSRRKESNVEFETMVKCLQDILKHTYSEVGTAFLEFATPDIDEALHTMIQKGVTSLQVYPFFLNSGKHVHHDIPDKVNEAKKNYPQVNFTLLSHFGSSENILSVITHDLKNL